MRRIAGLAKLAFQALAVGPSTSAAFFPGLEWLGTVGETRLCVKNIGRSTVRGRAHVLVDPATSIVLFLSHATRIPSRRRRTQSSNPQRILPLPKVRVKNSSATLAPAKTPQNPRGPTRGAFDRICGSDGQLEGPSPFARRSDRREQDFGDSRKQTRRNRIKTKPRAFPGKVASDSPCVCLGRVEGKAAAARGGLDNRAEYSTIDIRSSSPRCPSGRCSS